MEEILASNQPVQTHKKPTSQVSIWMAMISIYLVWGSTYLAIRFAVVTIPPFLMASFRFIVAGLILFVFRTIAGDPWPTWKEWRSTSIIGIFLLVGGNGGLVWAEQRVPSSLAALLVGTVPIWMILIDWIRTGGKKPSNKVLLSVIIGFVGMTVLFWPGRSTETIDITGAVVLVIGAISWAFGSLYSRNAIIPASPLQGTAMEMLAGGLGLFLVGTLTGEIGQVNFHAITTQSALGVFYLIVFGSLIGFASYTWVLRVAPISLVATYAYVNPLVAIILGYFIASENLGVKTFVAAAIILGSVILTTIPFKVKTKQPAIIAPIQD